MEGCDNNPNSSLIQCISEDWESFLTLCAVKTPMVYENILHFLPCSDLLELSLVSRFYRESSRRFLRLYKSLEIKLKSPDCCRLVQLNNMLEHAIELPCSGMYFSSHLEPSCKHTCPQHESLVQQDVEVMYPFIFQKLPVRNVTLCWISRFQCSTDKVLQKLLTTRISRETKYLELMTFPYYPSSSASSLKQTNWLQSLEIITMWDFYSYIDKHFWWEMLMSAPILKEIHSIMPAGMTAEIGQQPADQPTYPQIPRNKLNLLKHLCVKSAIDIRSLAHLRPHLHTLKITWVDITGSEEMANLLATVVEGTKYALQTLVCHAAYLLPCLINQHTGPLVKLHLLDIGRTPERFEDVWLLLATIDFATCLPKLRKVRVWFNAQIPYPIKNRASLIKSAKFKCHTVTDLEIRLWPENEIGIYSLMADVFPAIKTFRATAKYSNFALWERVCTLWDHSLERVSLEGEFRCPEEATVESLTETLENLCSDISREELQFVMETCPGGLQSWNYAATKRAVCLEFGITKVTCVYTSHWRDRNARDSDRDRLDRMISWIRLKIPDFVFQYEFTICDYEDTCKCFDVDVMAGLQIKTRGIPHHPAYHGPPRWKRDIQF